MITQPASATCPHMKHDKTMKIRCSYYPKDRNRPPMCVFGKAVMRKLSRCPSPQDAKVAARY